MDVQIDRSSVDKGGASPKSVSIPSDSHVIRQQVIQLFSGVVLSDMLLPSFQRVHWEYLAAVLNLCNGNMSEAARRTGTPRRTYQRLLGSKRAPAR